MKQIKKLSVICIAGVLIAVSTPINTEAAEVGELPVAGISVSLDKYYTVTDNPDRSTIQALSIYNDYGDNLGIADVDNHLNIRKGPGQEHEIIGKLPKDAGCYIYEIDEEGWAKISSGGVSGYVSSEYLIRGERANNYALKVGFYAADVNTMTLNVRENPTTDSRILTQVPEGEQLEVVEDDTIGKEWVKVLIDETEGYVNSEFVEIKYRLKKAVRSEELKVNSSTGVTSLRANMVSFALQFVGYPYVWGGNSLTNGVDCSGFVKQIYAQFGYTITRTSRSQAMEGTPINLNAVRPGDLVFYSSGGTINHVAMYIGNGQIVHASSPREGIMISNMYYQYPCKAVRIIND